MTRKGVESYSEEQPRLTKKDRPITQKRDVLIQLSFLTSNEIHTFEIFLLAVFSYLNVTYLKHYLQYLALDTKRGVCRSLSPSKRLHNER
jgi:hypothetical protein